MPSHDRSHVGSGSAPLPRLRSFVRRRVCEFTPSEEGRALLGGRLSVRWWSTSSWAGCVLVETKSAPGFGDGPVEPLSPCCCPKDSVSLDCIVLRRLRHDRAVSVRHPCRSLDALSALPYLGRSRGNSPPGELAPRSPASRRSLVQSRAPHLASSSRRNSPSRRIGCVFRLDVFHRIDSRCAIARVLATFLALATKVAGAGGAVTPAGAVSSHHVRAFCEALVRCVALLCTCVCTRALDSPFSRRCVACSPSSAGSPALEVLAARSSHALPHDELGHPGLSAAPEMELQFRMGAVPAVTPVLSTDVYKPTIRLIKNGHPPALVHSARFPMRAGVSVSRRVTHRGDLALSDEAFLPQAMGTSVPRTLRHRSLSVAARCAVLGDPGPLAERCPPASAQDARCDNVTRTTSGRDPIDRGSLLRYRVNGAGLGHARSVFPNPSRSSLGRRPASGAGSCSSRTMPRGPCPVRSERFYSATNSGSTTLRASNSAAFAAACALREGPARLASDNEFRRARVRIAAIAPSVRPASRTSSSAGWTS